MKDLLLVVRLVLAGLVLLIALAERADAAQPSFSAAALEFVGKPTDVHCAPVTRWPIVVPQAKTLAVLNSDGENMAIYVRPAVCRDLHRAHPWAENIDAFTEGLVLVRFQYLETLPQIDRAVHKFRGQVCRILHVHCSTYPKPERKP